APVRLATGHGRPFPRALRQGEPEAPHGPRGRPVRRLLVLHRRQRRRHQDDVFPAHGAGAAGAVGQGRGGAAAGVAARALRPATSGFTPRLRWSTLGQHARRRLVSIAFTLNGKAQSVDADPRTPLLWVLRDTLGLT